MDLSDWNSSDDEEDIGDVDENIGEEQEYEQPDLVEFMDISEREKERKRTRIENEEKIRELRRKGEI